MKEMLEAIYAKVSKGVDIRAYQDLRRCAVEALKTDEKLGVEYLLKLSDRIEQVIKGITDPKKMMNMYDLHKRVLLAGAPYNFHMFLLYMEWNREPSKKFYPPRRKALKPAVDALQELADGKLEILSISLPPGAGKLIANDTPVFTRDGWKKHGDLAVGDEVVGFDGEYKKVQHVFPKDVADYEVEFTNGEKIKCHGNHEWVVYNRHKNREEIVTTAEMAESVIETVGRGTRKHLYFYQIPCKVPLKRLTAAAPCRNVAVKSIRKIEPEEGNCIQVEGGVYCVGKTMIPTHNSTMAIFYICWLAGRDPSKSVLTGSHSNAFVRGAYDECLRVMDANGEYLFRDVFPLVPVTNTNAKDCRIDLGTRKRFDTLQFTSIGTGNAGLFRASNLLYCDDLIPSLEVALSRERLDKLWDQYTTDLRQRKIGDAKELHIATRWSPFDVIGRLAQEYEGSGRAKFIVIPALNEKDESNFDYPYGVGFTTKFYREQRAIMDSASWKALYMNDPIVREGRLYDPDELQRFFELPDEEPDAILAVCDTKDRGEDYCAMPILYKYGQRIFVADFICDNGNPDVVEAKLVQKLLAHHVHAARFESNSAGGRVAQKVQEEVRAKGGITKITTKFSTANKETRIIVAAGYVKEHFLFRDADYCKTNPDYKKAMDMICNYTMAGRNKHDDSVDALAMAVDYIDSFDSARVQVFRRPF